MIRLEDVARSVVVAAGKATVSVAIKADVVKDNAVPFAAKHVSVVVGRAATGLLSIHDRLVKYAK